MLQLVIRKQAVGQTEHILHLFDAEDALVLEIVNGHQGLDMPIVGKVAVLRAQQRRDHAGLPVMGVDQVRLKAHQRQEIERRAAEECKSLIFIPAHAVDVVAAEVVAVVHKVKYDAVLHQFLNAAVLAAPAQLHLEIDRVAHL